MRGWIGLYLLSWRLGVRGLLRQAPLRQALIRLVIPLDPNRYLEMPWALRVLAARRGDRVLDLASPKLVSVALAREGVQAVTVDLLESEIAAWRRLAGAPANLHLAVADGRRLPFGDGVFDHAFSISVVEHIADRGDREALAELARIVRPGGRVVLTVPFATTHHEVWRDEPLYGEQPPGPDGRYFFERWYDAQSLDALLDAVPELRRVDRSVVGLQPDWHRLYTRWFPWLIALGPFYGLLAREVEGPLGTTARVLLVREASSPAGAGSAASGG